MADDIIEIEDYEVKDTQIIETDNEDEYQRSISLNNTSLLIILMVAIVLMAIFIMTFD